MKKRRAAQRLRDAPDALLEEVLNRPLDRLRIRDWDNIAADTEGARRGVPEPELEHNGLPCCLTSSTAMMWPACR